MNWNDLQKYWDWAGHIVESLFMAALVAMLTRIFSLGVYRGSSVSLLLPGIFTAEKKRLRNVGPHEATSSGGILFLALVLGWSNGFLALCNYLFRPNFHRCKNFSGP